MKDCGLVYTSPYRFRAGQKLQLLVIPPVASFILKSIAATCRIEVRGREHFDSLIKRDGRVLLAIWHETLALGALNHRNTGAHTLTSYSFDGELAARVVKRFGMRAVRGSSSRGGSEALGQLSLALEHVTRVGFTLDGPRGPRRVAKPGIAILAARAGIPVIPHAFVATRRWRVRSWIGSLFRNPSRGLSAPTDPLCPPQKAKRLKRLKIHDSGWSGR